MRMVTTSKGWWRGKLSTYSRSARCDLMCYAVRDPEECRAEHVQDFHAAFFCHTVDTSHQVHVHLGHAVPATGPLLPTVRQPLPPLQICLPEAQAQDHEHKGLVWERREVAVPMALPDVVNKHKRTSVPVPTCNTWGTESTNLETGISPSSASQSHRA